MRKLPRTGRRLGLVALAAMPMLGASALSATSAVAASVTAKNVSASTQAQTLAYWTQARRDAAKSVDVIAGNAPTSSVSRAAPDGPPSAVAGSSPSGTPSASLSASLLAQPVPAGQSWGYPFPYDAFAVPVKSYKTYPYKVNGTIFFVNNGGGFKCSGTAVVNGHHASEVWTAGHCVANTESGNKFDESAEFIPAYNGNGITAKEIEPFGTFVANYYETVSTWLYEHNVEYDYGAMLLNNSSTSKKTLSKAVGTDGFAWNWSENEQFVQFGYPGEAPYNGSKMEENIAATGPCTMCTGSPFTGGSSGGAWNIFWTDEGPGYINGHTDYYYTNAPLTKYSPYIDTLANEVRCLGKPTEC